MANVQDLDASLAQLTADVPPSVPTVSVATYVPGVTPGHANAAATGT